MNQVKYMRTFQISWKSFLICFFLNWRLGSGMLAEEMIDVGGKLEPSSQVLQRALNPKTLVIFPNSSWDGYLSTFLASLVKDGHEIHVHHMKVQKMIKFPVIRKYGAYLYTNIVLVDMECPHSATRTELTTFWKKIHKFMSIPHKGNVMAVGFEGLNNRSLVSGLISRFGISVAKGVVVDYVKNFDKDKFSILTNSYEIQKPIYTEKFSVLYKGSHQLLDSKNHLVFPLLTGSPTTLSLTENSSMARPQSGADLVLVSALQSNDNSRFVFTSFKDLCGDNIVTSLNPPNIDFCVQTSRWVFQQTGVLEWSNFSHHAINENFPRIYKVGEEIVVKINFHKFNRDTNLFEPFTTVGEAQLQYTMLNPYWRVYLDSYVNLREIDISWQPETDATALVRLKCPDIKGIFKFTIRLAKKGYSFVHIESLAPIRDLRHDERDRFSWCAFPYYVGILTSFLSAVFFSIAFLNLDHPRSTDHMKQVAK